MEQVRVETPISIRTELPEQTGYYAPETLDEALELLSKYKEKAVIYAGGTDLLIDLRIKNIKEKTIIDIKRIRELNKIEYIDGKELVIGTIVTIEKLLENPVIRKKYDLLWKSIKDFADLELRYRATIGGNLCNASPAADTPLPLLVYEATVELKSKEGTRIVPLKEFFTGVKKTVIKPWEMLTVIHVPEPPENSKTMYLKYMRASEDLMIVAIAGLAANVNEPENRIVRLSYGAVAPVPLLIKEVENIFKKKEDTDKLIDEAVKLVLKRVSPITDVRATAEYRAFLVETGTKLMLKKLLGVRQ